MLLGKSGGHQLVAPEKNEAGGPEQKKKCLAVDVSDDESKIQCCKYQYCVVRG